MNPENTSGQTMGFTSVLLLIFITLKLTSVIDWSWWWVFAPFWIPLGLVLAIFLLYVVAKLIK